MNKEQTGKQINKIQYIHTIKKNKMLIYDKKMNEPQKHFAE